MGRIESGIDFNTVRSKEIEKVYTAASQGLLHRQKNTVIGCPPRSAGNHHVTLPIGGYCTRRLLTMTWLDGRSLLQRLAEDPPQEERNRIAEALVNA